MFPGYGEDWSQVSALEHRAWEAAAQAVVARQEEAAQEPGLLYVVVAFGGDQIQLCGAYLSAEEAGSHLAHARAIMPERHVDMRACPFARAGQARKEEQR
jgi:hypothetical protein